MANQSDPLGRCQSKAGKGAIGADQSHCQLDCATCGQEWCAGGKGGVGKSSFLMPAQDAQVVAEEAKEVFGTTADWIEAWCGTAYIRGSMYTLRGYGAECARSGHCKDPVVPGTADRLVPRLCGRRHQSNRSRLWWAWQANMSVAEVVVGCHFPAVGVEQRQD